MRSHANYPWHRDALVGALGTSEDVEAVAGAMAELLAEEVEERVFAAGGVAAVHPRRPGGRIPECQAIAAEPLVGHRALGSEKPRIRPARGLPVQGVRVLDLTRVIAGPVCTRFLGSLGADVLRVDPPGHPDMPPGAVADTLLGKRSALLDLTSPEGLAILHGLLEQADVVVHGYRPGSLDRFGLGADELADSPSGPRRRLPRRVGPHRAVGRTPRLRQHRPGGLWDRHDRVGRRDRAGRLPCQLLDHGTGYLAAAAVLDGLRRQGTQGGTHLRYLSLARTAWWLTSTSVEPIVTSGSSVAGPAQLPWIVELPSADGPVTVVSPPGQLAGQPLRWSAPLTGYGNDQPEWPAE